MSVNQGIGTSVSEKVEKGQRHMFLIGGGGGGGRNI